MNTAPAQTTTTHNVSWEIDLEADTPRQAAQEAWNDCFRRGEPGPDDACVFQVRSSDGATRIIDLSQDEERDEIIPALPRPHPQGLQTSELDKQRETIENGSDDLISRFLGHLESRGIQLSRYHDVPGHPDPQLRPLHTSAQQLIADFFGIDLEAIESERRALLDRLRDQT